MTQLLWPCWWVCPAHFKGLKIKTLINPTPLHSSEGRTGSFLSIVSVHGADEKIFEVCPQRESISKSEYLGKRITKIRHREVTKFK